MRRLHPGFRTMLPFITFAAAMLLGLGGYTFWYARGLSYFSDDPAACANCHVMQENYISWGVSSHRSVTCNDCHVPHDLVGKYLTKAENGFHHSVAFTFHDVQVIRIRDSSLRLVERNCVDCHESMVSRMLMMRDKSDPGCSRCHKRVGHL